MAESEEVGGGAEMSVASLEFRIPGNWHHISRAAKSKLPTYMLANTSAAGKADKDSCHPLALRCTIETAASLLARREVDHGQGRGKRTHHERDGRGAAMRC